MFQNNSVADQIRETSTSAADPVSSGGSLRSKLGGEDFVTVLLIAAFIVVIIWQGIITYQKKWTPAAIKVFSLSMVTFFASFTALTVSSSQVASAVFALLGIIAGHTLSRSNPGDGDREMPDADNAIPVDLTEDMANDENRTQAKKP